MMKLIKNFLIATCIMLMPFLVNAQPPDIEEDPNYGVEDVKVPFDDGVSLLFAAGIVYGLVRVRTHRKNEKNKEALFQL